MGVLNCSVLALYYRMFFYRDGHADRACESIQRKEFHVYDYEGRAFP